MCTQVCTHTKLFEMAALNIDVELSAIDVDQSLHFFSSSTAVGKVLEVQIIKVQVGGCIVNTRVTYSQF